MLLSECLDKFITEQKIKGHTDKTVNNYIQQITYFIDFSDNIEISIVDNELYYNYILYLKKKHVVNNKKELTNNLSSYTINTYLTHLKAFLNFCRKKGYLVNQIEMFSYKTKKNSIVVLSNNEIKQILSYYDENTFLGCRNLLILSFMIDCGLRLSEVINLNFIDVNLDLDIISVFGKGQKQRLVPLSDTTKKYFIKYSTFIDNKNSFLFYTYDNKKLTNYGVSSIIRRLKKNLGFTRLYPHYFRHTFATLFLLNGGSPLNLQIILGHTTLSMTQKYVHVVNQMNIAKQKSFAPLSHLD